MKNAKLLKPLVVAALVGASLGSAVANDRSGYARDGRDAVVKSAYGLCWRTGYWTPSMAIAECDADLVAKPAPIAQPTPQAAPQPQVQKETISTDGLFAFGKADLQPKGAAALDALYEKIRGAKIQRLQVTGHTDRIGTAKQNDPLSLKRATVVKNYLVTKGIDQSVISSEGKGSSQPKTAAGQCKGGKSKAVIACLAPDRRVDVEVEYVR